jgi:hypothetical protein
MILGNQREVIVGFTEPFDQLVDADFSQQLVELGTKTAPFGPQQVTHWAQRPHAIADPPEINYQLTPSKQI